MRAGKDKVEDLWNEEEQERLRKVGLNPNDSKGHSRDIAERIAGERTGGVPKRRPTFVSLLRIRQRSPSATPGEDGAPVVIHKPETHAEQRQHEVQAEQMAVHGGVRVLGREVEGVVEDQQKRDDDGLHDLNPVNSSQDIDRVGAEDGAGRHIDVVKHPEIDQLLAHEGLERDGEDDGGNTEVDEVDDQERDRGEGGDEELVAPSNVEDIVTQTE